MASETTAPDPESPTVEVLVTRAQPSLTVNTGLRVRKSLPVEALKRIGFAPTSSGRSKPSSNQLIRDILRKPLYLDCSYVEFLKVKKDLIKLSSNLQNAVKVVKMQKKIVNKQIEKWLKDSDNILQGVQSLENKIASVQGQGQGFSSLKWLSQFRLRKKVAKKTRVITSLLNDVENRFPAMSSGISSFSTFMSFKSWSLACQNMMEALKEYDVSILALCAMAGAGKTIFAREVGKKALELQLFDEVVMVDASQQSDSHKIRSYVVDCLELKLANNGEYGAQDLSDNLRLRRVLIILDDVWKKPNLEEIGIPYGGDHGGCKILLTISNRQVCSSMNIDRTIELDVLDDKDSCSLFRTVVGLSDSGPDDDIYKVAESIATECHGFPLLVVKLGRSLKQKAEEEWGLALERHESSSVSSAVICGYMDEDDEFMISYEFLRSRKTKMCFLLMCSLFPQGYDIDVEDFLKYIWGVRLFREVGSNQSIEDQRCEMWRAIEELKAYYLLLGREGNNNVHVKLHNLVRECALSIASGLITTLTPQVDLFEDLPEDMARDIDTAIIKMARHTQLPDNYMVHGNIPEILLLHGLDRHTSIIRDFLPTFQTDSQVHEFLNSALRRMRNLRTLHLEYCQVPYTLIPLDDLTNLEILSFRGSDIYGFSGEVFSAWRNLRMLDLYDCLMKEKIRPDLIHKLYMQEPRRLEELRIGGPRFKEWPFEFEFEFQVASPGGSNGNARVSDRIKSLPFLPILSLDIPCLSNPDQDMVFPKLLKYQIAINDDSGFHHCYPISRVVKVTDLSFNAVKELFRNVQHLHLNRIAGYQNLVPCAGADLDELTFLALRSCPDMEFILDMKQQHVPVPVPVPHCALSELEELIIEEMGCLKQLCNGRPPQGFLQKLRRLTVTKCADMMFTVAATQSLQELSVKSCDKLQSVFHSHSEEKHASSLLSCLRYLELIELPELRCVWSGPIHQVSLQSLQNVMIKDCNGLTSLFSLSLAQSLVRLRRLQIHGCRLLKQIVSDDDAGADKMPLITNFSSPCFPSLSTVEIVDCHALEYIFPTTAGGQVLPQLRKARVQNCSKLQGIFQDDGLDGAGNGYLVRCLTYLELTELPELRSIWIGSNHKEERLPSLRYVLINNCHRLTSLFSSSRILKKLETLQIHGCRELKQLVHNNNNNDDESITRPRRTRLWRTSQSPLQIRELEISDCGQLQQVFITQELDDMLPHLRKLALKGLTSLNTFCPGKSPVCLPSLQELKVEACPRLSNFTISYLVFNEVELEELCLSNLGNQCDIDTAMIRKDTYYQKCEYLTIGNKEEIFELQGGFLFWKLKKLILKELSKLQVIWKDEMQIVTLQNLTYLEVYKCHKLTSILSLVLAPYLPQLAYLKVQACENLENLISKNQNSSSSTTHLKSKCFPQLAELYIEDCNKLTSLFPLGLASLVKLKKITVKDASSLRHIFEVQSTRKEDDQKNVASMKEIALPQLEELVLANLPELISFSPLGYYFVFPSLRLLDIKQCDKMIMKFITNDSEPPYIRAQIEVSLWPAPTDNAERCINPELHKDINWSHIYGQN